MDVRTLGMLGLSWLGACALEARGESTKDEAPEPPPLPELATGALALDAPTSGTFSSGAYQYHSFVLPTSAGIAIEIDTFGTFEPSVFACASFRREWTELAFGRSSEGRYSHTLYVPVSRVGFSEDLLLRLSSRAAVENNQAVDARAAYSVTITEVLFVGEPVSTTLIGAVQSELYDDALELRYTLPQRTFVTSALIDEPTGQGWTELWDGLRVDRMAGAFRSCRRWSSGERSYMYCNGELVTSALTLETAARARDLRMSIHGIAAEQVLAHPYTTILDPQPPRQGY